MRGRGILATTITMRNSPMGTGTLIGTWKLQSLTVEYQDTGEKAEVYGAHPHGYLGYGADCRMFAIIVRGKRIAPTELVPTDAEKLRLFDELTAYAGTYTVEGDKVSHHVDISWNEAWTGTTQVRFYKIEGNQLRIRSEPAKDPLDGRLISAELVFTRVR
jgi:hypothetical protein